MDREFDHGLTSLMLACRGGFKDAVDGLMRATGADLHDFRDFVPITRSASGHGGSGRYNLRGAVAAQVRRQSMAGTEKEKAEHKTAEARLKEMLHRSCGKDKDGKDTGEVFPLSIAAEEGHAEIVHMLLEAKANPNRLVRGPRA